MCLKYFSWRKKKNQKFYHGNWTQIIEKHFKVNDDKKKNMENALKLTKFLIFSTTASPRRRYISLHIIVNSWLALPKELTWTIKKKMKKALNGLITVIIHGYMQQQLLLNKMHLVHLIRTQCSCQKMLYHKHGRTFIHRYINFPFSNSIYMHTQSQF